MIYLTSDYHIHHQNIIKYDRRPDTSVAAMNKRIIDTTNEYVKEDDVLIYGGDLMLDPSIDRDDNVTYVAKINEIVSQLRCPSLIFVAGNHDRSYLFHQGEQVPNWPLWNLFQTRYQCMVCGFVYSPTGTFRLPTQCKKGCPGSERPRLTSSWSFCDYYPMGYEMQLTAKQCADHDLPKEMKGMWITFTHYALRVWRGSHKGRTLAFHGHSHHSLPGIYNSFDVGWNGWNRPLSLKEIHETIMPKHNLTHPAINPHH